MPNGRDEWLIVVDKFIITGLCDKCGELKGYLKNVPAPAYGITHMYVRDNILYHVHSSMTKARVKCNDESH